MDLSITWMWFLDDVSVNSVQIIREAKKLGYVEKSGIYLLGEAARYLRDQGHKVERWET